MFVEDCEASFQQVLEPVQYDAILALTNAIYKNIPEIRLRHAST